jgi:hypothetical protein
VREVPPPPGPTFPTELGRARGEDATQKRREGLVFRAGYLAFRILHRALTGRGVEVGNFSVVPFPMLARIVGISEIWNHYAAGVYQRAQRARRRRQASSTSQNSAQRSR